MPEIASDVKSRQGAHVSEMQRRRLLSAIVEVLGEHGLEGTTVGRICKQAGVSRRTFYDLFEEREACFLAAFELALVRLSEKVAPAYLGEDDPWTDSAQGPRGGRTKDGWRERVRAALTAALECFDEDPGLARMCLVETLKSQPEVLERRQVVLRVLAAAVDAGRQEARSANPPPLTAESTVGGVVSVVHARLLEFAGASPNAQSTANKRRRRTSVRLLDLVNPLMSMIVLPYLGPAAARRELEQPMPTPRAAASSDAHAHRRPSDPFKDLPIRITFRTARVLSTIGSQPDANNKEIGQAAGVGDQGQMSKLLHRLRNAGLIENRGVGQTRGEPNAWQLTARGHDVLCAVDGS